MSNRAVLELARGAPGEIAAADIQPEIILQDQEQADFNSFLNDIDNGLTFQQFEAQIATPLGQPVTIDNVELVDGSGRAITGDRQVAPESVAILRQEIDARDALSAAQSRINDFQSYLSDILSNRIASPDELDRRIKSASGGNSVIIDGSSVTESRRVNSTQVEILESAVRARDTLERSERLVTAVGELYQRLSDGEFDSSEAAIDELLSTRYPELLRQPEQLSFIFKERERRVARNERLAKLDMSIDIADTLLTSNSLGTVDFDVESFSDVLSEDTITFISGLRNGNSLLRGQLLDVLRTVDIADLRAFLDQAAADVSTETELTGFLEQRAVIEGTVAPELRRLTLERTVRSQLRSAQSLNAVEDIRTFIETCDVVSPGDEQLLAQLRVVANQREEEINTLEAWQLAEASPTEAIEYTFGIREPAKDNRYTLLLSTLYSGEIARFETEAYRRIEQGVTDEDFEEFLKQQNQLRPAAGIDFTEEFTTARSRIDKQENYVSNLNAVVVIQGDLYGGQATAEESLEKIDLALPGIEDADLNEALKMRVMRYVALRKDRLPADFEFLFGDDTEDVLRRVKGENYDFEQGLGRNFQASRYIARQYKEVIQPLFESLRGNRVLGPKLERYLSEQVNGASSTNPYRISATRLAEQRPLSTIEASYISSVELLSQFNPQLVGLTNEVPEILGVYLENHFREMDRKTRADTVDDAYFPLVQLGLGAQGLVSSGEVVRYNPEVAEETLYIDDGFAPGGPFERPKGPGWLLNSKGSTGTKEPTLPDLDPVDEMLTVRAYGSPLRWYVGERKAGLDTRPGSINMSVDYLTQVDAFQKDNYPDNEEETLALQLQAAFTARKALFSTEFVGWEETDDDEPGDKRLLLKRVDAEGNEDMFTVRTDNLIVSSGLGRPNFGINLNTQSTQDVIQESERREKDGERPLLTDGLGGFKLLSSREERGPGTGKVWVVYGGGNTVDTLVENLAGIFGQNRGRGELEKIFVVQSGDFDERDRYALIDDVKDKQGRPNITEKIQGRVSRVEKFETDEGTKVRFYDGNSLLRDRNGEPIVGDIGVSGAGFTPDIGERLAGESDPDRFQSDEYLDYITLPTNPGVAVADRLKDQSGIITVGTASRTGYEADGIIDPAAKFLQLLRDPRRALQDNGAENAVAIGVRGPDTQAAIRLFLEDRLERKSDEEVLGEKIGKYASSNTFRDRGLDEVVDVREIGTAPKILDVPEVSPVRDNVERLEQLAEGIVLQSLADIRFRGRSSQPASSVVSLEVKIDTSRDAVTINGAPSSLPIDVFNNPYFVSYAQQAIAARKGSKSIRVELDIDKGRVNPRTSSVLAA